MQEDIINKENGAAVDTETTDIPAENDATTHSEFSRFLNKYFHHIDNGGKLSTEITAGILMCIVSICGMFMNMQLISSMLVSGSYSTIIDSADLAQNGEIIAATYFAAMLIAFVGSLVIGLIARLPFVQVSGLGLSTVLISLMGSSNGLTYYNLLAISFISAILYAVVVSVPATKRFLMKAIPAPVKKAIPAAVGILIAFIAIQCSGLISLSGTQISGGAEVFDLLRFGAFDYDSDRFHPTLLIGFFCALLTIILVLIFKARKVKRAYLWSLLIGTVVFIVAALFLAEFNWVMTDFSINGFWSRIWMIGSEDAMQNHVGDVFANLGFGKVFSEGFDFSLYTGNVFILFVTGLLTMLFAFSFNNESTVKSVLGEAKIDGDSGLNQKNTKLALMCNAGINVVAPLFGGSPVGIGQESVAGASDKAKSGIASVVAAIGFFISMFFWLIPALFATYTSTQIEFNMYGHYGKVMQLLSDASFGIVCAVMAVVGLSMVKHSIGIDWKDFSQNIPFIVTVAGTLFLSNIAYGAAIGCVTYTLIEVLKKPARGITKINSLKAIGIPTYTFSGISLLLLIFAFFL